MDALIRSAGRLPADVAHLRHRRRAAPRGAAGRPRATPRPIADRAARCPERHRPRRPPPLQPAPERIRAGTPPVRNAEERRPSASAVHPARDLRLPSLSRPAEARARGDPRRHRGIHLAGGALARRSRRASAGLSVHRGVAPGQLPRLPGPPLLCLVSRRRAVPRGGGGRGSVAGAAQRPRGARRRPPPGGHRGGHPRRDRAQSRGRYPRRGGDGVAAPRAPRRGRRRSGRLHLPQRDRELRSGQAPRRDPRRIALHQRAGLAVLPARKGGLSDHWRRTGQSRGDERAQGSADTRVRTVPALTGARTRPPGAGRHRVARRPRPRLVPRPHPPILDYRTVVLFTGRTT